MLRIRATFSWPTLRVGHEKEINTVARTRANQKAGYFFVAQPVNVCKYEDSSLLIYDVSQKT